MEISQLKNFLAVLEHGAISQAAHQLGIAQPALSQSIARMEKSLGVKLFERSRSGALPTAAALAIADDVKSGLFRLDEATRTARATRQGLAGRSEERRVGKECDSRFRSRGSPYH